MTEGTETITDKTIEKEQDSDQSQDNENGDDDFDKDRAMATIKKLRGFEREAKKLQKVVDDLEAAKKAAADAELSELDRAKKQLAEANDELAKLKLNNLRTKVAQEAGLPVTLASRIQGDDEDSMLADAKGLVEALGLDKDNEKEDTDESKQQTSRNPLIRATRPGQGSEAKETDAQKRSRLFGGPTTLFDPAAAAQQGGGVIAPPNE